MQEKLYREVIYFHPNSSPPLLLLVNPYVFHHAAICIFDAMETRQRERGTLYMSVYGYAVFLQLPEE